MGQGRAGKQKGRSHMAPPLLLARTLERPKKDQSLN